MDLPTDIVRIIFSLFDPFLIITRYNRVNKNWYESSSHIKLHSAVLVHSKIWKLYTLYGGKEWVKYIHPLLTDKPRHIPIINTLLVKEWKDNMNFITPYLSKEPLSIKNMYLGEYKSIHKRVWIIDHHVIAYDYYYKAHDVHNIPLTACELSSISVLSNVWIKAKSISSYLAILSCCTKFSNVILELETYHPAILIKMLKYILENPINIRLLVSLSDTYNKRLTKEDINTFKTLRDNQHLFLL